MAQTHTDDIDDLREHYKRITADVLPAQAADEPGRYPIRWDHCYQRIVLDNLFRDEWYAHVDGRPAYKQLTAEQLREAISLAEQMVDNPKRVAELNRRSLEWRGRGVGRRG